MMAVSGPGLPTLKRSGSFSELKGDDWSAELFKSGGVRRCKKGYTKGTYPPFFKIWNHVDFI